MAFKIILLFLTLITTPWLTHGKVGLNSNLLNSLQSKKLVNILVTMEDSTDAVLHRISGQFSTRAEKLENVVSSLQLQASQSQRNILSYLNRQQLQQAGPLKVQSLWISNQVAIKGADKAVLKYLASLDEVVNIEEERFFKLNPVLVHAHEKTKLNEEIEWSINKVEAPKAWAQGYDGRGVKVGTIDTGVRSSHESLRENYVGTKYYGWFDPSGSYGQPFDDDGHGSHVTATLAGSKGVGVAPGSKWMACRGCGQDGCSLLDLAGCFQFMLCPTDTQGQNQNCSLAPQIVSNSWGGGQGDTFFRRYTDALETAGVVVVFAMGNDGPDCGTGISPGDNSNVIGVGATTIDDKVAYFSGTGPTIHGLIKPDISAPGHTIRSAGHLSDTEYAVLSGTSMATPNLAGVVALMLSKNPNLSLGQIKGYLYSSGEPTEATGLNCGGISENEYPNHHVGHGRINGFKALEKVPLPS